MNCPKCGVSYRFVSSDDGTARNACRCEYTHPCMSGKKRCGLPVQVLVDPYDVSVAIEYRCAKHLIESLEDVVKVPAPPAKEPKAVPVKAGPRRGCRMQGCSNRPVFRVDFYKDEVFSDYCKECAEIMKQVLVGADPTITMRSL